MTIRFAEALSCSPSSVPGSYIYSALPTAQENLLVLSSADELILLDTASLKRVSWKQDQVPKAVTCIKQYGPGSNLAVCAGRKGEISTFDVRILERVSQFMNGLPLATQCSECG